MNDTTFEPMNEDAIFIDTRKPIIRWLPLLMVLALAAFQAYVLVRLGAYRPWSDERIFYPLIRVRSYEIQLAFTGVTMLIVIFGAGWANLRTIAALGRCLIFLVVNLQNKHMRHNGPHPDLYYEGIRQAN